MDSSSETPLVDELRNKVLQKLESLEELPTLPDVALRVLELAQDENVGIKDLKQVIITDPPLSAKLMKVANSAYYARRVKAKSIDDAIVTIGLNPLVTICSSMSMMESFSTWEENALSRSDIWKHSLSTAFLAKSFEMRKAMFDPKEPDIFLCGILHNIGWIVIDQYYSDELKAILNSAEEINEWNLEYETDVLGMSHAELGAHFLKKWGLPDEVADVVAASHKPEKAEYYAPKAALIQQCASIAPYQTHLEPRLEELSRFVPNRLEIKDGENVTQKMQDRYHSHIAQAKVMTDHFMDWLS